MPNPTPEQWNRLDEVVRAWRDKNAAYLSVTDCYKPVALSLIVRVDELEAEITQASIERAEIERELKDANARAEDMVDRNTKLRHQRHDYYTGSALQAAQSERDTALAESRVHQEEVLALREALEEADRALIQHGYHQQGIPELSVPHCDYDPETGIACDCGFQPRIDAALARQSARAQQANKETK